MEALWLLGKVKNPFGSLDLDTNYSQSQKIFFFLLIFALFYSFAFEKLFFFSNFFLITHLGGPARGSPIAFCALNFSMHLAIEIFKFNFFHFSAAHFTEIIFSFFFEFFFLCFSSESQARYTAACVCRCGEEFFWTEKYVRRTHWQRKKIIFFHFFLLSVCANDKQEKFGSCERHRHRWGACSYVGPSNCVSGRIFLVNLFLDWLWMCACVYRWVFIVAVQAMDNLWEVD